jgi:uncharacterized protein YciI
MPYICFCKDHPDTTSLRKEHTQAHLRYIETILEKILVAGPLIDPDSGNYNSSCFIYQVETRDEALELLHNDPYYIAGIFKQVHCQPFRPAAGSWIGGKTW